MLELSRIADAFSGFVGSSAPALPGNSLEAALAEVGVSLEALAGSSVEDVAQTLAEHGIDASAFAPDELQSLVASLDVAGGLDAISHAVLSAHELR